MDLKLQDNERQFGMHPIEDEIDSTGRPALGVNQRQKGIWVLQATQMPAVLIETGFISNYDDERYLNSDKGQQEIAESIARALIKYKKQIENLKSVSVNEYKNLSPGKPVK